MSTTAEHLVRHFGNDRAWALFKNGFLGTRQRGHKLTKDEIVAAVRKSLTTVIQKLDSDSLQVEYWQHQTLEGSNVHLFFVPNSSELAIVSSPSGKKTAVEEAQKELDKFLLKPRLPDVITVGGVQETSTETKVDDAEHCLKEWVLKYYGDKGNGYFYFPSLHIVVGPVDSCTAAEKLLEGDARRAALSLPSSFVVQPQRLGSVSSICDVYAWSPFASLPVQVVAACRSDSAADKNARIQLRESYTSWTTASTGARDRPIAAFCARLSAIGSVSDVKTDTPMRAYKVSVRDEPDTHLTVFTCLGERHAKTVGRNKLGCKKVQVVCLPSLRLTTMDGAHIISSCAEEEEGKESESDSE
jgi:hypothetical protein